MAGALAIRAGGLMSDIHDDRAALFANLESAETQPKFWDQVADDVDWTVEGTHALCYLDSAMVDYTVHRNENLAWQ
jgi:hypothetical protein